VTASRPGGRAGTSSSRSRSTPPARRWPATPTRPSGATSPRGN